jgi:hypothetical protein
MRIRAARGGETPYHYFAAQEPPVAAASISFWTDAAGIRRSWPFGFWISAMDAVCWAFHESGARSPFAM